MSETPKTPPFDVRLGNGFDVHRFGPGSQVTLCGVTLPHDHGLVGHSDADVGMHAITDALYGARAPTAAISCATRRNRCAPRAFPSATWIAR